MKTFLAILSCFLLVLSGCRKTNQPAQQSPPATSGPGAEQLAHPQGGAMSATETKYFKGSIGSALGLQMKLVRDGVNLTGQYFYQKIGTRIDLRGSIDKDGQVVLQEFDPSGKQTGTFKGSWTTNADDGLVSIAGNWTKPDGQKQTAFSLHEEPISLSNGVEVIAKAIKEDNKKLNYEIDVEYPQVMGLLNANLEKFNHEATRVASHEVTEFKKNMAEDKSAEEQSSNPGSSLDIGYTVALASDDVISIQFDVGTYYAGAAHPNSNSEVLNFDVKNGGLLKLADLFKPGAKYLDLISAYAIKDLKKQSKAQGANAMLDDQSIEGGASASAKNYGSWTVTKKGLAITFDAYQVGPYAAGPQNVVVPYSALKDIINPDGVLGPLAKPKL